MGNCGILRTFNVIYLSQIASPPISWGITDSRGYALWAAVDLLSGDLKTNKKTLPILNQRQVCAEPNILFSYRLTRRRGFSDWYDVSGFFVLGANMS